MSELRRYLNALEGINHAQWKKLKLAIDRQFAMKRKELDATIQLDTEKVSDIIRSQFGCKQD